MDDELEIAIFPHQIRNIFLEKYFQNKIEIFTQIKSVVRMISAITNNRSISDLFREQFGCCTAALTQLFTEDQFEIRDLMAVQWKNHIMWNPTIPQDKKFSTVIAKCSNQSEKQTLVDFLENL